MQYRYLFFSQDDTPCTSNNGGRSPDGIEEQDVESSKPSQYENLNYFVPYIQ